MTLFILIFLSVWRSKTMRWTTRPSTVLLTFTQDAARPTTEAHRTAVFVWQCWVTRATAGVKSAASIAGRMRAAWGVAAAATAASHMLLLRAPTGIWDNFSGCRGDDCWQWCRLTAPRFYCERPNVVSVWSTSRREAVGRFTGGSSDRHGFQYWAVAAGESIVWFTGSAPGSITPSQYLLQPDHGAQQFFLMVRDETSWLRSFASGAHQSGETMDQGKKIKSESNLCFLSPGCYKQAKRWLVKNVWRPFVGSSVQLCPQAQVKVNIWLWPEPRKPPPSLFQLCWQRHFTI